jgi:hypothetical protein
MHPFRAFSSRMQYFFSDYLQTVLRVNLNDAARLFALAGVTAAVIGPLLGLVYDRVGRMPLFLFISSCVLVPASVVYLFNAQLGLLNTRSHMALLIAAIVLMAVAEVSQKTIVQVLLVRVLPIAHFSVLQGCIVALTNACVAITFLIVGASTKRDASYTGASALIEALMCVLLLLSGAILLVDVRDGGALSIVERSGGDPDRVDHAGSGASVGDGRRSSRGGIDTFDDDAGEEDDHESAKLVRN